MHKAFEYEWKGYDREGRPVERHVSIGPALVSTVAAVILAVTGHGLWNGLKEFVQALRGW